MEIDRARLIAERLHADDREADHTPLLDHLRRVVGLVPEEARAVAYLHEALEWTGVSEQELLMDGLEVEELRALRLLHCTHGSRSDHVYLSHLHLIACAAGHGGRLARTVKIADLQDRCLHPRVRADGWSPAYRLGLAVLMGHPDPWHAVRGVAAA